MNEDLKIIKKKYGEKMMKLCRESFPTLLESEGLLSQLMLEHFDPSHVLYENIISDELEDEFKDFIYSLIELKKIKKVVNKNSKELLEEAGYDLYECRTEEEIQSFRKYYQTNEMLCTFEENRLSRCYVFFAVKKSVDDIRREDFKNPQREDLYGTSVISIQFTKNETHTLSIKNRYNHTVNNPDATFRNNLDNIIEGLTESFSRDYGMIQTNPSNDFEIPNYVRANDGRYYKYNYEINNIYYCTNNVIIDNFEVKKLEHNKLLLDYFVLDLQKKTISLYDDTILDCFPDGLKGIKQIKIVKEKETKKIVINTNQEDIIIKIDNENKIIKYQNNTIKEIKSYFLQYNKSLNQINLSNVIKIENDFLYRNELLKEINLPNVEEIGNNFLFFNKALREISLPNVRIIEDDFLEWNRLLIKINLPKTTEIGNYFLYRNELLKEISLPNVTKIQDGFLYYNKLLKEINLPNVTKIENYFLCCNNSLTEINLPNVEKIGTHFLLYDIVLEKVELPSLQQEYYPFLVPHIRELILMPKIKKLE